MKKELDENAILQRMTREELSKVKGGYDSSETNPGDDRDQGVCECLLAGCDLPKQRACDTCLANI